MLSDDMTPPFHAPGYDRLEREARAWDAQFGIAPIPAPPCGTCGKQECGGHGSCPFCDGKGATPNGSCTGDQSGGWADTCDDCGGKGVIPASPPEASPVACICGAAVKVYREAHFAEWWPGAKYQVRCETCWCAAPLRNIPEEAVGVWNQLCAPIDDVQTAAVNATPCSAAKTYQVGRAQTPAPSDPTFSDITSAIREALAINEEAPDTVIAIWDMTNPGAPPVYGLIYQGKLFTNA